MIYDYGAVNTNHPLLSRLLFLTGSGVTRDQALLDHWIGVGATYRFANTALTLQYFRDEALETRDVTDSVLVSLIVLAGDHWSFSPELGYSESEDDSTAYAGLSVSYHW
jgi:hypothetical protein